MSYYLQISAVAVLLTILISLRKYSRIQARRKYQTTIFGAITKPLTRVYLKPDLFPDWIKEREVNAIVEDLKSVGFIPGKSYFIKELNGILLYSLFQGNIAAVIVKHPMEGVWTEIIYQREDGKFLIESNSPIGNEIDTHKNIKKFYQRYGSPIGLYNTMKSATAHTFGININEDNFKEIAEEYYRRELCWKNNQGGLTIEDFKENIKNTNSEIKITREDLRKIFLEMKVNELHQWHSACIHEYRHKKGLLSSKFDYLEVAWFIVPKKTISHAFIEYLANYDIIDKNIKEKLIDTFRKKADIQKIFEIINNAFSKKLRARYVGEVEYPLQAHIYQRSDNLI